MTEQAQQPAPDTLISVPGPDGRPRMEPLSVVLAGYTQKGDLERRLAQQNEMQTQYAAQMSLHGQDLALVREIRGLATSDPERAAALMQRAFGLSSAGQSLDGGGEVSPDVAALRAEVKALSSRIQSTEEQSRTGELRGRIDQALKAYPLFNNSPEALDNGRMMLAALVGANGRIPLEEAASRVFNNFHSMLVAGAGAAHAERTTTAAATTGAAGLAGTPSVTEPPPPLTLADTRNGKFRGALQAAWDQFSGGRRN